MKDSHRFRAEAREAEQLACQMTTEAYRHRFLMLAAQRLRMAERAEHFERDADGSGLKPIARWSDTPFTSTQSIDLL